MPIDVNQFDSIEVKFVDKNGEPKVEFFGSELGAAKSFVNQATQSDISISSITYFMELMIRETNSHIANQPHKRFGEKHFSVEEFLSLPNSWVKERRENTTSEIDAYMAEKFEAKPAVAGVQ